MQVKSPSYKPAIPESMFNWKLKPQRLAQTLKKVMQTVKEFFSTGWNHSCRHFKNILAKMHLFTKDHPITSIVIAVVLGISIIIFATIIGTKVYIRKKNTSSKYHPA